MKSQKLNLNLPVVLGNWHRNICQADFDDTPLNVVKYRSFRAMLFFSLKGFIILESSRKELHPVEIDGKVVSRLIKRSYHVVFDRRASWSKNLHVLNSLALETQIQSLQRYVMMQAIRETCAIRQSSEGEKAPPRIVCR